jgi:hypothetical protein
MEHEVLGVVDLRWEKQQPGLLWMIFVADPYRLCNTTAFMVGSSFLL